MKKLLVIVFCIIAQAKAWGQFGVNFHQSNLPFVGLNYEIKGKIRPEVRLGTDNFIEDTAVEFNVMYDVLDKEDFEVYGGVGIRGESYSGVTIPVGLNVYPLTTKNFGFHIEVTPIFGEDTILRGSWGIRYRFRSSDF